MYKQQTKGDGRNKTTTKFMTLLIPSSDSVPARGFKDQTRWPTFYHGKWLYPLSKPWLSPFYYSRQVPWMDYIPWTPRNSFSIIIYWPTLPSWRDLTTEHLSHWLRCPKYDSFISCSSDLVDPMSRLLVVVNFLVLFGTFWSRPGPFLS